MTSACTICDWVGSNDSMSLIDEAVACPNCKSEEIIPAENVYWSDYVVMYLDEYQD